MIYLLFDYSCSPFQSAMQTYAISAQAFYNIQCVRTFFGPIFCIMCFSDHNYLESAVYNQEIDIWVFSSDPYKLLSHASITSLQHQLFGNASSSCPKNGGNIQSVV